MPQSNRRVAKPNKLLSNFFRPGLPVKSGGRHDKSDGYRRQRQGEQMKVLLGRCEHLREAVIKYRYQLEAEQGLYAG